MTLNTISVHEDVYRQYDLSDDIAADGYPTAWHTTIKHDVRARANSRCLRCGHPYRTGEQPMQATPGGLTSWSRCDRYCAHAGEVRVRAPNDPDWIETVLSDPNAIHDLIEHDVTVEAAWRILTVHHLDGDKLNCRWWNLVSLCQRCHLTIQRKVQLPRVWPWEHSAWFKPYVAGYYAHVYLGEDLTVVQVLGRLDELLALEKIA